MDEPSTSSRKLPPDSSSPASEDEDDFFARKKRRAPMFDQLELSDDSEHLSGLAADPKLFVELNTALSASAACERLFSAAGLIFKPPRACTGDAEFEQLLLKLNKAFVRVTWCALQSFAVLPVCGSVCSSARVKLTKYYFRSYTCGLVSRGLLLFLLQVDIFTFYFYLSRFFWGTFTST